jgi:hypothetical protein
VKVHAHLRIRLHIFQDAIQAAVKMPGDIGRVAIQQISEPPLPFRQRRLGRKEIARLLCSQCRIDGRPQIEPVGFSSAERQEERRRSQLRDHRTSHLRFAVEICPRATNRTQHAIKIPRQRLDVPPRPLGSVSSSTRVGRRCTRADRRRCTYVGRQRLGCVDRRCTRVDRRRCTRIGRRRCTAMAKFAEEHFCGDWSGRTRMCIDTCPASWRSSAE